MSKKSQSLDKIVIYGILIFAVVLFTYGAYQNIATEEPYVYPSSTPTPDHTQTSTPKSTSTPKITPPPIPTPKVTEIKPTITITPPPTPKVTEATPLPTPLPTPSTGSLTIISFPFNADIYIDGSYQGKTPKLISGVSLGAHTITLQLFGYAEWSQSFNVVSGTNSVSATLIPSPVITSPVIPTPLPTPIGTPISSFTNKNPTITRIEWYFLDSPSPIHYTRLTESFPKNAFGFVRVYYRSDYGTKYIGKFDIEVRENIPVWEDKTIITNPQTISIDSTMPEAYLDTGFQAPISNSVFIRINGNVGYIFDLSGSERALFSGAEIIVK